MIHSKINTENLAGVRVLSARDVFDTLDAIKGHVTMTHLDPWYNRGVGGIVDDYHQWLYRVIKRSSEMSEHVLIWGFPDIIYKVLDNIPKDFKLVAWLTWYYKNCPSVIRGWRSAQLTCIHISREGAKLYPEHFLNEAQLERKNNGTLRYLPGPPSVIEAPLIIGFVGKKEQTGHRSQKPEQVIERLVLMTTIENDIVLDPFCGGGTTGVVCKKLNRRAILGDCDKRWIGVSRERIKKTTNIQLQLQGVGR